MSSLGLPRALSISHRRRGSARKVWDKLSLGLNKSAGSLGFRSLAPVEVPHRTGATSGPMGFTGSPVVWGYFGSGKHLKSGLFYGGNLKNGALVFILGDAPFFIVLVAEVPFFQESWAFLRIGIGLWLGSIIGEAFSRM